MDEIETHRADDMGHPDCAYCDAAREAAEQHEPEKLTAVLIGGPYGGTSRNVAAACNVIDVRAQATHRAGGLGPVESTPLEQGEYRRIDPIAEEGRARFEWAPDEA